MGKNYTRVCRNNLTIYSSLTITSQQKTTHTNTKCYRQHKNITWLSKHRIVHKMSHDTHKITWHAKCHMICKHHTMHKMSHDIQNFTWYMKCHVIRIMWYTKCHMTPKISDDRQKITWYTNKTHDIQTAHKHKIYVQLNLIT